MAATSLRRRLTRSVLTLLTLATATAFLVYLLVLPAGDDPAERNGWRLLFALSLLVSVAGVMNALFMSVTQRSREIGTLKCLGATDAFVLLGILLEAALLGLGGAAVGAVAGLLVATGVGALEHGAAVWRHLELGGLPWKFAFAFAAGLGLATAGAAFPAWHAARIPPTEAMRIGD
jgi:ABC-type antimicrobial peptide transport system permease subunit